MSNTYGISKNNSKYQYIILLGLVASSSLQTQLQILKVQN